MISVARHVDFNRSNTQTVKVVKVFRRKSGCVYFPTGRLIYERSRQAKQRIVFHLRIGDGCIPLRVVILKVSQLDIVQRERAAIRTAALLRPELKGLICREVKRPFCATLCGCEPLRTVKGFAVNGNDLVDGRGNFILNFKF